MEQFLETCVQWQANLAEASRTIDAKAAHLEQREVALALDALVAHVELRAQTEQAAELEALRAAVAQQEHEAKNALQRMQQQQEERDAFEALERRLLDDRVAELEVQLAQNKLREVEKDEEITKLRAEQDELSGSNCVVPRSEWDTHLAAHQRLGNEADTWRQQSEARARDVAALQDELSLASLKAQELEDKLAVARAQEETRAFEDLEKSLLEERISELTTQLATQRVELSEALEAARMQLSVAEAEAGVKKNEVARLLNDKAALKKQAKTLSVELKRMAFDVDAYKAEIAKERARATQLAGDNARLRGELEAQQHAGSARELGSLQEEVRTLREQKQLRADDDARREEEIERLTWKERALTKQLEEEAAKRESAVNDAVVQLQAQHDRQLADLQQQQTELDVSGMTTSESAGESTSERVARLELEKREIVTFFRCYYEASETKCRQLMRELSQQQEGVTSSSSSSSSSSGIRGTILDGVSTRERIS